MSSSTEKEDIVDCRWCCFIFCHLCLCCVLLLATGLSGEAEQQAVEHPPPGGGEGSNKKKIQRYGARVRGERTTAEWSSTANSGQTQHSCRVELHSENS
jgi:hypothetical protein